jgi:hypothetical protein
MPYFFSQVPNVEYPKFYDDGKISEFENVKNIFKRVVVREDIFENLSFFSKYNIIGDERPDMVADKFYDDPSLDWVILLSNNIINLNDEWPLTQRQFDRYLLDKYGSYESIYDIHHFESERIVSSNGTVILKEGTIIEETFSLRYYDASLGQSILKTNISVPITNYEYETRLEDIKRTIYILKNDYLQLVLEDMKDVMTYKKGSTQYISGSLKRADNIKLTD